MVEEGGFYIRFSLQPKFAGRQPSFPSKTCIALSTAAHFPRQAGLAPIATCRLSPNLANDSISLDTNRSFSHSLRKAACCVVYIPKFRYCQHTLARHAA